MRRIALATALAAVAALSLAACGSGDDAALGDDYEVLVTASAGNGPGQEVRLEATDGAEATLDCLDEVTVTVTEVDTEVLVITTDTPMAPVNPGGGINLNDLEDEFDVGVDEPAQFATPTTDTGCRFEVALEALSTS